ncbi:hypothetical protein SUGI_0103470 [Cryptomeria japonica]|nr:hypothetical protein SUGI_0103470 [Cryptomeria japonica]
MIDHKFTRSESDPCIYYKKLPNGEFVILLLYVDDMLIADTSMRIVSEFKTHLAKEFAMKDLGAAKKILGITIFRDRKKRELKLSQQDYIKKVLDRFGMVDAKSNMNSQEFWRQTGKESIGLKLPTGCPLFLLPPSNGSFKPEIAMPVIQPMLSFLDATDSYFFLDVYPFFAWNSNPTNMLDAQLDAAVAAMAALGYGEVKVVISEGTG